MSHVAATGCFVLDSELDTLESVAGALGLELRRGQTSYTWFGQDMGDSQLSGNHDRSKFGQCVHALRPKNGNDRSYEIGLVKRVDGGPGYELLYDAWGGELDALCGKNLSNLKVQLSRAIHLKTAQRDGWQVIEQRNAQGDLQLICRR
jgi:hypothetical protein